jgi:hypothetical protein
MKTKLILKSNLTQWEKVLKLASELPNDMDFGKEVRKIVSEHNENAMKPPFTDDYIQ